MTKYASVSNGTLANGSNGLLNTNSMNTLTGVVNGNGSASGSIATNLMRSLLTSSNKNNTTEIKKLNEQKVVIEKQKADLAKSQPPTP